jgi:hypothetical protein
LSPFFVLYFANAHGESTRLLTMVKRADLAHASSASPRIKLQLENATHQPVRVPGQLSFVGGCGLDLGGLDLVVSTLWPRPCGLDLRGLDLGGLGGLGLGGLDLCGLGLCGLDRDPPRRSPPSVHIALCLLVFQHQRSTKNTVQGYYTPFTIIGKRSKRLQKMAASTSASLAATTSPTVGAGTGE